MAEKPKTKDKTKVNKAKAALDKKRQAETGPSAQMLAKTMLDGLKQRIMQALLDEQHGIREAEIMRRIELKSGDTEGYQRYRLAFRALTDEGRIARTSSGYKRGTSPWARTGGLRNETA